MRIVLTIIWALALFIFTCSVNFNLLIQHHIIDFQLNPNPDWSELLRLDFQWASHDWILRKIGHLIGFFILALLASNFGKYKSAFYLSIIYAALTEILQLFFFRGGRIYDVINDSFGVLLAYLFCLILFSNSSRHKRNFNRGNTSYANQEKHK
ncbi:VanZ family protein [Paenibacillus lautus]|uniref:VanZ family protein n=1 Tax=Paenibacillus lautus TaxID=1401 RepID=UPI002DBB4495|nr:VanZ family protein [Paenibacillus lautus]MEC0207012.1 VanZ family protein [Paenibacillus lautus]